MEEQIREVGGGGEGLEGVCARSYSSMCVPCAGPDGAHGLPAAQASAALLRHHAGCSGEAGPVGRAGPCQWLTAAHAHTCTYVLSCPLSRPTAAAGDPNRCAGADSTEPGAGSPLPALIPEAVETTGGAPLHPAAPGAGLCQLHLHRERGDTAPEGGAVPCGWTALRDGAGRPVRSDGSVQER